MLSACQVNFTVVIPSRNVELSLGDQLDALAAQTFDGPFEVIVVNNGSTDQTASIAEGYNNDLDLRVVEANDGSGVSYSRNAGAKVAVGDFVVFVDGDDIADVDLLSAY